jgi:hypothetical protein
VAYKRKTKKTGDTTRRTTTQSSKGTRITNTTKGSLGGKNKRTYSWSWNKNGTMRQTTTDNRNGWITRKSRTIGSKVRRSRSSRKGNAGDDIMVMLLLGLLLLPFKVAWWLLVLSFRLLLLLPYLIVIGIIIALFMLL